MPKSRLEAFTDAVIAIIMTILVLGLHEPAEGTFAALFSESHRLIIYVVSFLMLAIYWNNHHHLFQAAHAVNGKVLWANNLFLLSISIFPFLASWMGDYFTDLAPQLSFGIAILVADLMFFSIAYSLRKATDDNENVSVFLGRHYKTGISVAINVIALLLGILIVPELIYILNALMLILWVVPERHIEKTLQAKRR
ncbi:MAG: TMEM175 family protein [Raoultibacter sp.]